MAMEMVMEKSMEATTGKKMREKTRSCNIQTNKCKTVCKEEDKRRTGCLCKERKREGRQIGRDWRGAHADGDALNLSLCSFLLSSVTAKMECRHTELMCNLSSK